MVSLTSVTLCLTLAAFGAAASCNGDDDEAQCMSTHMLQTRLEAKLDTIEKIGHADVFNTIKEQVEDMVHGPDYTVSSMSKLADFHKVLEGEIMPELQQAHDDAEKDLASLGTEVKTHNKHTKDELGDIKHKEEANKETAKGNHAKCRTAEAPLNATFIAACHDLQMFINGLNLPAVFPNERKSPPFGPYLKTMDEYMEGKHAKWKKLDDHCTNSRIAYEKKRAECHEKQRRYEEDFCSWRAKLTFTCSNHDTLYDSKSKDYNEKADDVEPLEKKWKTEYTGVKKLVCFLKVWTGNEDVSTANAAKLQACNASVVDNTPMNIHYPGFDCKIPCDTTPVANYPGTAAFAGLYNVFSQKTEKSMDCEKDEVEDTPGPSPAPTPTSGGSDGELPGGGGGGDGELQDEGGLNLFEGVAPTTEPSTPSAPKMRQCTK